MAAETQVRTGADVQSTEYRYRFRDGIWEVVRQAKGWPHYLAASKELGISDTTLSRAVRGDTFPGEVLMARLMASLPRSWKHDHVFELIEVDGDLQVPV